MRRGRGLDGVAAVLVAVWSASAAVTVSLGEGRSAAGVTVPTDTAKWRLPMLPFVNVRAAALAP